MINFHFISDIGRYKSIYIYVCIYCYIDSPPFTCITVLVPSFETAFFSSSLKQNKINHKKYLTVHVHLSYVSHFFFFFSILSNALIKKKT